MGVRSNTRALGRASWWETGVGGVAQGRRNMGGWLEVSPQTVCSGLLLGVPSRKVYSRIPLWGHLGGSVG